MPLNLTAAKVRELSQRWVGVRASPTTSSPFGLTSDGMHDFRYANFESSHFQGAAFEKTDFTGSNLQHSRLEDCIGTDCLFRSCKLDGAVFFSGAYRNCSFSKATMRRAGVVRDVNFEQCDFESVNLTKASISGAIFTRIVFLSNVFQGLQLRNVGFWDCRFVGDINDIVFWGQYDYLEKSFGPSSRYGFHTVDLTSAALKFVGFKGNFVFDNMRMPNDGSAELCDVSKMLNMPAEYNERKEFQRLKDMMTFDPTIQPTTIVSKHDVCNDELYKLILCHSRIDR